MRIEKVTLSAANRAAGAKEICVKKGGRVSLKAMVTGTGSYSREVTLSASSKSVSISDKGILSAKKTGSVKVTATSKADPSKKASLKVTVVKRKAANKKLKLGKKSMKLKKGSEAFVPAVSVSQTTTDSVYYSSSDKSVAGVDAYGLVKGIKKGTAKIRVKCGKKKQVVKITVV